MVSHFSCCVLSFSQIHPFQSVLNTLYNITPLKIQFHILLLLLYSKPSYYPCILYDHISFINCFEWFTILKYSFYCLSSLFYHFHFYFILFHYLFCLFFIISPDVETTNITVSFFHLPNRSLLIILYLHIYN